MTTFDVPKELVDLLVAQLLTLPTKEHVQTHSERFSATLFILYNASGQEVVDAWGLNGPPPTARRWVSEHSCC